MKAAKALLIAVAFLPACSTMRPVESPVAFLEQNNPKHVRVYSADGEFYVLRDPQLRGDKITGFEPLEQEDLSLAVSSIRRMEAMQPDKKRTTLFIGAMTLIGSAGIYMIANAENGPKLICDNYDVQNRCTTKPTGAEKRIPLGFRLSF
jgi:hypothetical protein